jgi:transposase-like protein
MPWLETSPVEERIQFIADALGDRFTMSELCARYGISRRVGYKWLARYEEEGRRGLRDRSRAPHHCPHRIEDELRSLSWSGTGRTKLGREAPGRAPLHRSCG